MRVALLLAVLIAGCSSATGGGAPGTATQPSSVTQPPVTETAAPSPDEMTFAQITLSGRGAKVAKFKIPVGAIAIATITETGSSNFVVEALAADGSSNDLLVNEIGNYTGTVLFDQNDGEHTVAFKIDSNGSWKIVIKPTLSARSWSAASPISGKHDDVVLVSPISSGLIVLTVKHSGDGNFVIYAYGDNSDLLVNEIGHYSGDTTLPEGTVLLQITANGAWSITPS